MRALCLALLFSLACAHPEPARRPALVWTDRAGHVQAVRYAPLAQQAASEPAPAPQEPNVPRLSCNDGTLSVNCSPHQMQPDCCAAQGGVQHDPWGNVIAK